jgi:hypothetical protein
VVADSGCIAGLICGGVGGDGEGEGWSFCGAVMGYGSFVGCCFDGFSNAKDENRT